MDLTNYPSKVQIPFANATTYKYTIPVASQIGTDTRKASYTDGFPPLTMEPLSSGGVAPYGQDFNGVLNQLSAGLRWEQSNTPFKFDSDFCTSIGGYPLGAKLLSSDGTHYWINQSANNTVNPDTVGTNWVAGESVVSGSFPKSDKWTTPRTLSLTGPVAGSVSIDGSGNASLETSLSITSSIAMLTGTISNGGTIPLPSGYLESQCYWIPSIASYFDTGTAPGVEIAWTMSGRVVSGSSPIHTFKYLIIGIK